MKKEIYEIKEPLKLLGTKGVWRAHLRQTSGNWIDEKKNYERGDIVEFTTQQFVDADRAGFVGYLSHEVDIPVSVVLEAADAIRANDLPRDVDDSWDDPDAY